MRNCSRVHNIRFHSICASFEKFWNVCDKFTKEEQNVVDSELFTLKNGAIYTKRKLTKTILIINYPKYEVQTAYFGVNQTKLIGKLRQLKPINACDSTATTIETLHGDDKDNTAVIAVAYRGMFVYPESRSAVKRARRALIVDTDPTSDRKLLTLIATGEDEYANVDIPGGNDL